jgi:hypothetical protein
MSINLANGTPGRVDGAAVPAGKIGEVVQLSFLSPAMPAATTPINISSATLQPGIWVVYGGVGIYSGNSGVVFSADPYLLVSISTVSNTRNGASETSTTIAPANSTGSRTGQTVRILNLSVATTVYVVAQHGITTLGDSSFPGVFNGINQAVRIA